MFLILHGRISLEYFKLHSLDSNLWLYLMAKDSRDGEADVSVHGVEVSVADASAGVLDEDLTRGRHRHLEFLDLGLAFDLPKDSRLHGCR